MCIYIESVEEPEDTVEPYEAEEINDDVKDKIRNKLKSSKKSRQKSPSPTRKDMKPAEVIHASDSDSDDVANEMERERRQVRKRKA